MLTHIRLSQINDVRYHLILAFFWLEHFLADPVCNVVNLTKTVLYMEEMNHCFVVIYVFVGANSPNYGKNEEDENMIIKGNIIKKY